MAKVWGWLWFLSRVKVYNVATVDGTKHVRAGMLEVVQVMKAKHGEDGMSPMLAEWGIAAAQRDGHSVVLTPTARVGWMGSQACFMSEHSLLWQFGNYSLPLRRLSHNTTPTASPPVAPAPCPQPAHPQQHAGAPGAADHNAFSGAATRPGGTCTGGVSAA